MNKKFVYQVGNNKKVLLILYAQGQFFKLLNNFQPYIFHH